MVDRVCLIVDDEPAIRRYVRAILARDYVEVLEATSVAEALKIVEKLGSHLDLVVSDIKMPGDMNGVDLACSIHNSFPALPVILISGYADAELARRIPASFAFIKKPFVPETILDAARRAFAVRDQSSATQIRVA